MRLNVTFALLVIMTSCISCTRTKAPILEEPAVGVAPRGESESKSEFISRLNAQTESPVMIPPKGEYESHSEFILRLKAQMRSNALILPKEESEDTSDFRSRLNTQIKLSTK